MKITPDVFEAYLKCPTKCWLRATDEPSTGAHYSEWVKTQNDSYRLIGTRRLVAEFSNDEVVLSPDMENFKVAKWRLASNLAVQAQMDCCALESEIHALERMPAEGQRKIAFNRENRCFSFAVDRSHASHAPAATTCNSRAQIIRPAARPLPKPCFFVRAKCAQDPRWSAPDRNQAIDSVLEDFLQEITERRPPDEHAMSSTG